MVECLKALLVAKGAKQVERFLPYHRSNIQPPCTVSCSYIQLGPIEDRYRECISQWNFARTGCHEATRRILRSCSSKLGMFIKESGLQTQKILRGL